MQGSPDKELRDPVEAEYNLTLSFKEVEPGGTEMDSSSSEDESEKGTDHEETINSLMEEIKELKHRLEESEKKCFAAEKLFELKQNDDDDEDLKMDEENRRVKEQLKWKMEQFKHLEEAHEKLKDEFLTSRKDWEDARSELVDEVSELKTRVESQTRISNELQTRLEMCGEALEHEESKIKTLEAELAESKAFYEKSFDECQEAKSELENLMLHRDEEIATLKSSLAEKEAMCKEYEYMSRKIEQENQELLASVKELQEAQIQRASSSSSPSLSTLAKAKAKLRNAAQKHKAREAEWSCKVEKLAKELEMKNVVINELSSKLEDLEKAHMNCCSDLKIKDDQLSSQLDLMTETLSKFKSELEAKDGIISELMVELEECHALIMQLKVENEETCIKLSGYQKGFAELEMKMESQKAEIEKLYNEKEGQMLMGLSEKERNLEKQSLEMEMESDLKAQRDALHEELERHKAMVMEISENERYLKEQCLEMECDLKDRMQDVCEALERADVELAEARCKESETEFELQSWKSLAEQLEFSLMESQQMRKQVEHSLLEEVEAEEKLKQEIDYANQMLEEKERIIHDLHKQIVSLGVRIRTRETDTGLALVEKDKMLQEIQIELGSLQDEMRRESEDYVDEKPDSEDGIIQLIQDKGHRIEHLIERLDSLEENFESTLNSFSVELEKKDAEISWILEAWEKIATAEKLAKLELEENEQMIAELDEEIRDIEQKLESQEISFRQMEKQALDIEDVLEVKQIEMKKLTAQMKNKLNESDALIDELRKEKLALYEDVMKLSTERESLMEYMGRLCDRISEFSNEDMQLMGMLGSMMRNFDDREAQMDLPGNDDKFNLLKENLNTNISPTIKKFEILSNGRSPFQEINSRLHLGASS
ncbi:unnamed protein product [Rhodiola kirilowii]